MRRTGAVLVSVLAVVAGLCLLGSAQQNDAAAASRMDSEDVAQWGHELGGTLYQYAAKVVEGLARDFEVLGLGQYCTSVNIHNPWCYPVRYRVKLAIAGLNGREDYISPFTYFSLKPDAVTEFDRVGFEMLLAPDPLPAFLEAYFVIEAERELDVVAVYTGNGADRQELATMEMERVPARLITTNLSMNISTGVADWRIVGVPGSGSTLSVGSAPIPSVPCSAWVDGTDAGVTYGALWSGTNNCQSTAAGDYAYELTFDLCCGSPAPRIDLRLWADNEATVWLNGSQVGQTPPSTGSAATSPFHLTTGTQMTITTGFVVGLNRLRVVVHNDSGECPIYPWPIHSPEVNLAILGRSTGNPSGMLLDGWLSAYCP